ncbi:hypothetical protein BIZ37_03135 [Photobacterium sp. BZF1]|uniref:hypothetical protein n=1 Tax=Photobacterium sp. BZF1 TaxID=1904457 RepID=UPI001653C525|nr:hypothetical protein [Photobacterium sp. BZF1]MBC7001541.1 hypothetical protein [Photobacterium sp. BZF1]
MNDIENKHNVDCWLKSVSKLDLKLKSDINPAIQLLNGAPPVIFGPVITETQNEAIAYWLELCQQLVNFYQNNGDYELAFRYKQFCYSKLQALAIAPQQDAAIKRWCIKKLEIMVINMLEFCQQQSTVVWQNESQQLIDAHVHFMQSMNHQNLSLGSVFVAPQ